ncbi:MULTISPECIES: putative leader peptide [Catenulispora]|uniref:putative leader peptide n=1 Tax=Catenulispora TaxID=414878 RepID=UPI0034DDA30F
MRTENDDLLDELRTCSTIPSISIGIPTRTAREVKALPTATGYYSRRHIDLQRIASALCPAHRRV